jgi:two-component system, response regulator FlrC
LKNNSDFILSHDLQMRKLLQTAENVAQGKATVLITGESGTGKELLSRFIHAKSSRSQKSYVAINCAALPEGLLESELFGFEKGAFTGAEQRKLGKFELANGGTFLLDEVSELPLLLQSKLLRVLQEGEIERLGGSQPVPVNFRLIATTNKPLEEMVKKGEFRQDLFYRLNVIPLKVPALRYRPRDIEYLARIFLDVYCQENSRPEKQFSIDALNKLKSYEWPGNIRELQNLVERLVLTCAKAIIGPEDLPLDVETKDSHGAFEAGMTLSEAERLLIMKTLEHTSHNRTRAADILGISIRTLRNKLHEYRKEGFIESGV